MEVIVGLGIFFIIITAIFIAVAVFLPEWLGITGKKAKEVIESHHSESLTKETIEGKREN